MAEGPRLSVLLVVLLLLVINFRAYSAENQIKCENTPMKQIICEFGSAKAIAEFNTCLCTHIAVPVTLESDKDDETPDFTSAVESYKRTNGDLRSLAAISMYAEDAAKKTNQVCKEIVDVLANYDGVQLDLRQSDVSVDKSLVVHFFKVLSSEIDNKFKEETTNSTLEMFKNPKEIQLVLPPNSAIMTKYYDLKKLSRFVDFFIIATHNLVDSSEQGYTYHPSRLMGTDDLLNADSLIDLAIGLGVHHSSILISLPSTASKFELKDPTKNTPRSPTNGLPITLTRQKMCEEMKTGNWTVERDEDLTAPYAFMNRTWLSFEDSVSVSIKGKYILLRDLAGAVVTDVEALDWKLTCVNQTEVEPLKELTKTFTETARKSRSAQLLSLQEQLQRPADQGFYFNNEISYSPYYIERVVTRDGEVHVIRKDAKTEFECSRQGYFRHPSGCNRFYRCVKFDQQSNYFTVYEYDCPDGLAFDEKVEVCVWPGSLSNTGACQGSSEIAPVPRNQFVCPPAEGYYADPENCRWFFACLDHAKDGYTPLTAYEFRCPFGLVFDERSLKCDWQWKVGSCGKSGTSYANNNYGEQSYRTNLFNTLYDRPFVVPHENYPQYSFDSVNSHRVPPSAFGHHSYSTTNKPQISYGSTENYVTPPRFSYSPAPYYAQPNPQVSYGSPETYVKPFHGPTETYPGANKPQSVFYGLTGTYATTKKPEFVYVPSTTESYATTSKPQSFYTSTPGYPSSTAELQYSYGSTETHRDVTSKPQISHGPSESYGTTSKPQLFYSPSTVGYPASTRSGPPQHSYDSTETHLGVTSEPQSIAHGRSESYGTPARPQFVYGTVPEQPVLGATSPNYEFNGYRPKYGRFEHWPTGILYHQQQRDLETGSQFHNGILHHQQNNFQSIPVNRNYDSHKNDVQYPPLNDYETYSTTHGPARSGIANSRIYSENYSPSNVYSHPSIPYAAEYRNSYPPILPPAGPNLLYDSHRFDGQYRPCKSEPTHSRAPKPAVEPPLLPIYQQHPQSDIYPKPTSRPFVEEYLPPETSGSGLNGASGKSRYSTTTSSPYNNDDTEPRYYIPSSSTATDGHFNGHHVASSTRKPGYHDASLYKDQFASRFNFDDYLSRISSEPPRHHPSTTLSPSVGGKQYDGTSTLAPSIGPKPTVFYYNSSPLSPTTASARSGELSYDDGVARSTTPATKTTATVENHYDGVPSSFSSYPTATDDYKSPVVSSTYAPPDHNSPAAREPTVDYYHAPSSTAISAAHDVDSAFVDELIAKLSKTPISAAYSTTTGSSGEPQLLLLQQQNVDYPSSSSSSSGDYNAIPNDSFDIDEYVAKLSAAAIVDDGGSSTPKPPPYSSTSYKSPDGRHRQSRPLLPPPTSVYLSTTTGLPPQPTTADAPLKISSDHHLPEVRLYVQPPSLQAYSARPPVVAYTTQRPEQLTGYSSTVSDLIDYYHSVQSSLDSAYRSPSPGHHHHRQHYAAPGSGYPLYAGNNYTLPRGYEKDAEGYNVHATYPAYPLKPIIVEPVSAELNAEFERYYTAGIRKNLRSEENGKVFAIGDANSPLVGKLGAQCDCSARKKKPTVVSTTTSTTVVIDSDDDDDGDKTLAVKGVVTNTDVVLEKVKKPSDKKLCNRPGLFRDPKQCNKFYSCNWDKWTQKYELSDFKCPIHLAFDENLSACNWPSKGPACSHDTLINYAI